MLKTFVLMLLISSPAWVPLAFGSYAAGRRKYGTRLLIAFTTAAAVALAITLSYMRTLEIVGNILPP